MPVKTQLVSVGLLSPLFIAPPFLAELPLNMQFDTIGLLPYELQIGPPHSVVELLPNIPLDGK